MRRENEPGERYNNPYLELNVVEAALDGDHDGLRALLARMTAAERRAMVRAFDLVVDTMHKVDPEVLAR